MDPDDLVQRLLARAVTEGRADDTEEVIRHRQKVYADETAPLIAEYDARGLVERINGQGRVEHVTDRVHTAIARLQRSR